MRQALVAQQTGGHNATGDDSGGCQLDARVRARARQKTGHFDRLGPAGVYRFAIVLLQVPETS